MSESEETKTGSLPPLSGAHIVDVKECRVALVNLVDGYGEKHTKVVLIGPNGGMVFLEDKAVGREPQKWAKDGIKAKLAEVDDEDPKLTVRQA
jgi:hypothetical protein